MKTKFTDGGEYWYIRSDGTRSYRRVVVGGGGVISLVNRGGRECNSYLSLAALNNSNYAQQRYIPIVDERTSIYG